MCWKSQHLPLPSITQLGVVRPNIGVGWHIWHNDSFNPIYRAEQDVHVISKYSDFFKIVIYHNCGGERMTGYIDSVSQSIYSDVPLSATGAAVQSAARTKA